ncbi:MAG TPA: acyltransferase [Glaciibacter sp.]|nr:acyltransferase [Glaciibacter sp.]
MSSTSAKHAKDTRAPKPNFADRYALDGLRALAAVLVVFFHAYQNNQAVPGGFQWTGLADSFAHSTELAVDLFFVISGFVLWLPVAKAAIAGTSQRPGRAMLRRRAVRLIPLYYIVFLVVWTIANPGIGAGWQDLLLHLTFTQIYSDQHIFYTVGPAWSLAVEFHYYLLIALAIPVIGYFTRRASTRARRLAIVYVLPVALVIIGVLYIAWATVWDPQPIDRWSVWFSAPAKAADFGLGMIVATIVRSGWSASRRRSTSLVAVGLGIIAACILISGNLPELDRQWFHIVFAVAAALIVLSRRSASKKSSATPWGRMIAWIGAVSYSTYLLHELVMHWLRDAGLLPAIGTTTGVFVTFVLVYAVALALSAITYTVIEVPGQRIMGLYDANGRLRNHYAHLEETHLVPRRRMAGPVAVERNSSR